MLAAKRLRSKPKTQHFVFVVKQYSKCRCSSAELYNFILFSQLFPNPPYFPWTFSLCVCSTPNPLNLLVIEMTPPSTHPQEVIVFNEGYLDSLEVSCPWNLTKQQKVNCFVLVVLWMPKNASGNVIAERKCEIYKAMTYAVTVGSCQLPNWGNVYFV